MWSSLARLGCPGGRWGRFGCMLRHPGCFLRHPRNIKIFEIFARHRRCWQEVFRAQLGDAAEPEVGTKLIGSAGFPVFGSRAYGGQRSALRGGGMWKLCLDNHCKVADWPVSGHTPQKANFFPKLYFCPKPHISPPPLTCLIRKGKSSPENGVDPQMKKKY